jgi:hypothetical protein
VNLDDAAEQVVVTSATSARDRGMSVSTTTEFDVICHTPEWGFNSGDFTAYLLVSYDACLFFGQPNEQGE